MKYFGGYVLKPLGKKKIRHNYKDNHPQKGHINWWEADIDTANKKADRQKKRMIIEEQLNDIEKLDENFS